MATPNELTRDWLLDTVRSRTSASDVSVVKRAGTWEVRSPGQKTLYFGNELESRPLDWVERLLRTRSWPLLERGACAVGGEACG